MFTNAADRFFCVVVVILQTSTRTQKCSHEQYPFFFLFTFGKTTTTSCKDADPRFCGTGARTKPSVYIHLGLVLMKILRLKVSKCLKKKRLVSSVEISPGEFLRSLFYFLRRSSLTALKRNPSEVTNPYTYSKLNFLAVERK